MRDGCGIERVQSLVLQRLHRCRAQRCVSASQSIIHSAGYSLTQTLAGALERVFCIREELESAATVDQHSSRDTRGLPRAMPALSHTHSGAELAQYVLCMRRTTARHLGQFSSFPSRRLASFIRSAQPSHRQRWKQSRMM